MRRGFLPLAWRVIDIDDIRSRYQLLEAFPGDAGDGCSRRMKRSLEIKAQAGRGDHMHVELGEVDAGSGTDAIDPATDDVESVLGGIEQDAARVAHREAAQAWAAAGGDNQIEARKDLQRFGSPPMAAVGSYALAQFAPRLALPF